MVCIKIIIGMIRDFVLDFFYSFNRPNAIEFELFCGKYFEG